METLEQFAEHYKLKLQHDACGDPIIGRKATAAAKRENHHVYDGFGDGRLGVYLGYPDSPRSWGNARRALVAAGLVVIQDSDVDGCLTFDPANKEQVAAVLRVAHICPRRQMSEEQRAQVALRLAQVHPAALAARQAQTTLQVSI
jgi:hypothetical protein